MATHDAPRRSRVRRVLVAVALLAAVVAVGLAPSPFLRPAAGPAPRVEVRGGAPTGVWRLTTVRLDRQRWGQHLWSQLAGSPSVESGGAPAAAGAAQMERAKRSAWQAATALLGPSTPTVVLSRPVDGSPAAVAGAASGDLVVTSAGLPVRSAAALDDAVQDSAGAPVALDVLRGGAPVHLELQPVRRGGRWWSGLEVRPAGWPVPTGAVGGPSAGLVLALAYVEALGGGTLGGGRQVAGTGTVAPDGSVGPVGFVDLKAVGARRDGARVLLVPFQEAGDASGVLGGSGADVVGVDTLAGAVRWLCAHGGSGRACAAAARTP